MHETKIVLNWTREKRGNPPGPRVVGHPSEFFCGDCAKIITDCHLYIITKLCKKKGKFKSYFPTGCTHENYDGKPWCDSCVTLVENNHSKKIICTRCACLDWGVPNDRTVNFAVLE